ncbi:MAG: hypothetical protein QME51_10035, partial [Planctomycetota bacterium]|nr:hypothetical protein [Planctomycetota bacterium]
MVAKSKWVISVMLVLALAYVLVFNGLGCGKEDETKLTETRGDETKLNETRGDETAINKAMNEINAFAKPIQEQTNKMRVDVDKKVKEYSLKDKTDKFLAEIESTSPKNHNELKELQTKIVEWLNKVFTSTTENMSPEKICPEYKNIENSLITKRDELEGKIRALGLETLVVKVQVTRGNTYVGFDQGRNRNVVVTTQLKPIEGSDILYGSFKPCGTSEGKTVLGVPCNVYHYKDEDDPNAFVLYNQLDVVNGLGKQLYGDIKDKIYTLQEKSGKDIVSIAKELENEFGQIMKNVIISSTSAEIKGPKGSYLPIFAEGQKIEIDTDNNLMFVLYGM